MAHITRAQLRRPQKYTDDFTYFCLLPYNIIIKYAYITA